jgi:cysteine-rich repeat protein
VAGAGQSGARGGAESTGGGLAAGGLDGGSGANPSGGAPGGSGGAASPELCGNGVMDPGEECEYDSPGAGEACLPSCRCGPPPPCGGPSCGDGRLDAHEECDDGNGNSDDGCTACCERISPLTWCAFDQCFYQPLVCVKPWTAALSQCGNGIVETLIPEEECDDGNLIDGDGCSAICRWEPDPAPPQCGNAVLEVGEECDDGSNDGGYAECAVGCRLGARCGDAIVQEEDGELCDRGSGNNLGGYYGCESDCQFSARCGDGIVQLEFGEQCDDGTNSGGYGQCRACRLGPRCGDGVVQQDAGEQCDDDNLRDGDGCSSLCRIEG